MLKKLKLIWFELLDRGHRKREMRLRDNLEFFTDEAHRAQNREQYERAQGALYSAHFLLEKVRKKRVKRAKKWGGKSVSV